MLWFRQHVVRFRAPMRGRSERGATAVEYGLIVTLFVLGLFGVIALLRTSLTTSYAASETRVGAPQSQLAAPTLPTFAPGTCDDGFWPNPLTGACDPVPECDPVTEVLNTTTNKCDAKPAATVPGTPSPPSGTPNNDGTVALTWTAPSDGGSPITNYQVQYRADSDPVGVWSSGPSSPSTSVTTSPLTVGTTYTFRVAAVNAVGAGGWSSASGGVVPRTLPGAPTNLVAVPDYGTVALTWTAPASNGGSAITDYVVQYATSSSGPWTTFADGTSTATSATVNSGLTNGLTYYFQVAAVNAAGTGPYSSPPVSSVPVAPTAPATPEAPTCVPSSGQLVVSWVAPDNGGSAITTYRLQRAASASGPWGNNVDTAATSATVTGLTNGTTYYFQVRATNTVGSSSYSPVSSCAPATVPGAPGKPAGTAGYGSVALTWTAPASNGGSAVTDYVVQYRPGSSGAWTTFADGTSTSLSATVTGLSNATAYTFQVAAVNAIGQGAYSTASNSVTTLTPAVPSTPAAPTCVVGDGQVTVSWVAPNANGSAITSYRLRRTVTGSGTWTTVSSSATSPYSNTGLTNGTSYNFRIRATNSVGNSTESASSVACIPATVPGAPGTPAGTAGPNSVALTWTAAAANGSAVTDYVVQYRLGTGGTWTTFADGTSTATSATVTGLTGGSAYYFRVAAENGIGQGTYSSTSTAVTPTVATAPDAPAKPSVARAGTQSITVTWVEPDDGGAAITNYQVSYGTTTSADTTTTTTTSTSATIAGLTNGTTYYFKVRAQNSVGWSSYSTVSDAIIPKAPYSGTTPSTRYPASGYRAQGDNSSLTLSTLVGTITGISYTSLSGAPTNVSLNSSTGVITFGNWNNNNTAITVNWSIAETTTTLGTSGSFTLYVT